MDNLDYFFLFAFFSFLLFCLSRFVPNLSLTFQFKQLPSIQQRQRGSRRLCRRTSATPTPWNPRLVPATPTPGTSPLCRHPPSSVSCAATVGTSSPAPTTSPSATWVVTRASLCLNTPRHSQPSPRASRKLS
ncbi:hypothetical protein GLYMA_20G079450v4 [Glycine max]|nr:hypothetical protein GLYMA_20G079450v4 [Glycine max]KAH1035097.1 hypothetical protein GYH30_055181 [Glycine max]